MSDEKQFFDKLSRRTFTKASVATALGMATATQTKAAQAKDSEVSKRIRIGVIGVGIRGNQLIKAFLKHSDAEIVAVCDVFQPYLDKAKKRLGEIATYTDYRDLIARDDLDAVAIATPDHWHALQCIDACNAGKDVYVEKPLCVTVYEGRKMVEAARRNDRVVQVGTHRRSSALYQRLSKLVRENGIGHVTVSRAYRLSNMYPNGIGRLPTTDPPAGLDWDMWLGPRPSRPYQDNITPYKFRWWNLYSTQMGNWGVHYLDAIRWMTGEEAPSSICAMGGRFIVDDDRVIPDTMEVTFEFASGRLAIFGQYEASGNPAMKRGEIELRGTQGTIYADAYRYDIVPERGGQFQDSTPRMEAASDEDAGRNDDMTILHTRNFLDCVVSRELPNADIEIGHRSTSMSLLANISLATRSRLEWDAEREVITNNEAANELLHYEYRKPWTLG